MGISFCRVNGAMTEKLLNDAEVGPVLQKMGSIAVSEGMGRDWFRESGPFRSVPCDSPNLVPVKPMPPLGGKEGLVVPVFFLSIHQKSVQSLDHAGRERHHTVFLPFAAHKKGFFSHIENIEAA